MTDPSTTDIDDYMQAEVVEVMLDAESFEGYKVAERLALAELRRRLVASGRRGLSFSEVASRREDLGGSGVCLKFEAFTVPTEPTDAQ